MQHYHKPGTWNAICNKCLVEKNISSFYLHSNGKPRKQCKECHYASGKLWQKQNRDLVNTKARNCTEAQRVLRRIQSKNWRQANLAYDAYRSATYRARKLQATTAWSDKAAIEKFYAECPSGFHVDHIIPLKGKQVSGLHVETNLQYLSAINNIRKRNKYAELL